MKLKIKRLIDIIVSLLILVITLPVLILIGIFIKVESKGPILFKQKRLGYKGKPFYIYKYRTMVINAEELKEKLMAMNESDGPAFKIKRDPRITPFGLFLRSTSLDELPLLFNVIKGDMSIIGPRPPLPMEYEHYEDWMKKRLLMKPGITCTWQIIPNRNDVAFEKWMKLDIEYIENWSLKKDFILLFKTLKSFIGGNMGY